MTPERAWELAPKLMPNGLLPDAGDRRIIRIAIAKALIGYEEALRPIVGDAYDTVQPIAPPDAPTVKMSGEISTPPEFQRAQRQRKDSQ